MNILLLKRPAVWMLLLLILQLLLVRQRHIWFGWSRGLISAAHIGIGNRYGCSTGSGCPHSGSWLMIFTVQAYRHRERVIGAVPISHQQIGGQGMSFAAQPLVPTESRAAGLVPVTSPAVSAKASVLSDDG